MSRDRVPPYTSWGGSRTEVDNAGVRLRDYWLGSGGLSPDVEKALQIAWMYRAEFQSPLTKVVMGLRSFLKTEHAPVVVGQRLKRTPTILDKLQRLPNMKLTRMQDIGGCRAILPAGNHHLIDQLRARIEKRDWDVQQVYDYIATPKASGYRGVHIVVLRDHRLIEIQLRTEAQHSWAETVERLGSISGHNLKDGQGPNELLLYLERAAYGTNLQELGQPLPDAFRREVAELAKRAQPFLVRR